MSNRLASESSPYLLQHAHNPVDWYPWGEEALSAAREQQKPILVSIGYAACHWCHVMERESFEDARVAAFMNELFINIKIDREERPDLDHIYMDAVQSMTGSGGWPLNVFLTPEGFPFYGGTYYPPEPVYNRPSWSDVLHGIATAWKERREEIYSQAERMTSHLENANRIGGSGGQEKPLLWGEEPGQANLEPLHAMAIALLKTADRELGGFGRAPKFPQTMSIGYLLRYAWVFSGNRGEGIPQAEEAKKQALLSLDRMIAGGIYDQLGGGLARYSTDNEWLVPHFEKMLYDQALFIGVLADAYQITRNPEYERVIHHTMDFLQRELLSPEGGFYAALDADSEGEEGKFYVWEKGELDELLGEDAGLAAAWYGISARGNWEGINILTKPLTRAELSTRQGSGLQGEELDRKLASIEARMMERRSARIRPGLDDKQLLGWNALMNQACARAYAATGREAYRELAIRNMDWMLKVFPTGDGSYRHTYKNGQSRFPAFLDDYAYLVQALIYLQEMTGETRYWQEAERLTELVINEFGEEGNHLFYYTGSRQTDVIVRKREVYDGAQPSGNAVMLFNLQYLGLALDRPDWVRRATGMLSAMEGMVGRYPGSFGFWAMESMRAGIGAAEIVVIGADAGELRKEILANFIPFKVLQSATSENEAYPLLRNKPSAPESLIYVCRNYSCRQPVASVGEMLALL